MIMSQTQTASAMISALVAVDKHDAKGCCVERDRAQLCVAIHGVGVVDADRVNSELQDGRGRSEDVSIVSHDVNERLVRHAHVTPRDLRRDMESSTQT